MLERKELMSPPIFCPDLKDNKNNIWELQPVRLSLFLFRLTGSEIVPPRSEGYSFYNRADKQLMTEPPGGEQRPPVKHSGDARERPGVFRLTA